MDGTREHAVCELPHTQTNVARSSLFVVSSSECVYVSTWPEVIAEVRKERRDGSEGEGALERGKITHWCSVSISDYLNSLSNEMTLAFIFK